MPSKFFTSLAMSVAVVLTASYPMRAETCDPNYTDACVPISSDVDCAGGQGNGPSYVTGPVKVVGSDVYELDREGDGIACEPKKKRKS